MHSKIKRRLAGLVLSLLMPTLAIAAVDDNTVISVVTQPGHEWTFFLDPTPSFDLGGSTADYPTSGNPLHAGGAFGHLNNGFNGLVYPDTLDFSGQGGFGNTYHFLLTNGAGSCAGLGYTVDAYTICKTSGDYLGVDVPMTYLASGGDPTFSLIDSPPTYTGVISSGVAGTFISGVGTAVKTSGLTLWIIVAAALSIPLAFWTIHRVIELFPVTNRK